ncbi:hypothetical protein MAP00_008289 [Monascus purpureus]|nr:hypothetical protein MAP00_008289 [Monascus purpureus]
MSETLQELADIPKDFVRDGSLFIRRCTKPDKREFIKISQAVGMGFLIMVSKAKDYVIWVQSISFFGAMLTAVKGAIGYFIKLIHIPVNNILVGGA